MKKIELNIAVAKEQERIKTQESTEDENFGVQDVNVTLPI